MKSNPPSPDSQAIEYEEFGLRIERVGEAYAVMVTRCPRGDPDESAPFVPPCDSSGAQALVSTVAEAIRRDASDPPRVAPPETAKLEEFGRQLYDAVFANKGIRDCYLASLAAAHNAGKGLRLKLHVHRSLAGLPWELLYGDRGPDEGFLVLSAGTPVVRFMAPYVTSSFPPVEGQLRILAVLANPTDGRYETLDMNQERKVLEEALKPWTERRPTPLARLDWVEGHDTIRTLRDKLRENTYQVLHFSGHARYDAARARGLLVMEGPDGESNEVEEQRLLALLMGAGGRAPRMSSLRLVFLNSCWGAQSAPDRPFSGLARSLVRSGVPAVVAMQYPVSDLAATELTSQFYLALLKRYPLDAALTLARQSIYVTWGHSLEWTTPVLYMVQSDDMAFDLARPAEVDEVWHSFHALESLYQRARAEASAGRHRAAVVTLESILEAQPAYRDAVTLLDASRQVLTRIEEHLEQARRAMATRDYQRSIDCLDRLRAVEADNAEASQLRHRAQALITAQADLERCSAKAQASQQEEDWKHVAAAAELVLKLDAAHPQAQTRQAGAQRWLRLEGAYGRLVALMEARQWRQALVLAGEMVQADAGFRDVQVRHRRIKEALQSEVDQVWAEARQQANSQQLEQAIESLDRLLGLDPQHPHAAQLKDSLTSALPVVGLVNLQAAPGRASDPDQELQHRLTAARALGHLGQWDEVAGLCEQALRLSPQHAEAQELLGQAKTELELRARIKLRGPRQPHSPLR